MLNQNIYINGLSAMSAQPSFDEQFLDGALHSATTSYRKALDVDYKKYLNPTASRRFSRLIKMSLVAAQKSIEMADGVMPDAIITGTGLGCLEDTEKFLRTLIESEESMLSPTAFIQSTHNTISGQIAMMLACYHSNYTYSNRYFSFESSLLDGMLMIGDTSCKHVLVHSADEVIPAIQIIMKRMQLWDRSEKIANKDTMPVLMGEGVVSLLISSEKKDTSIAAIKGIKLIFKLSAQTSIQEQFELFLNDSELSVNDIDVLILGMNGDVTSDSFYKPVQALFNKSTQLVYKHLFGESFTASSFAYWMAAQIIHHKKIEPTTILVDKGHRTAKRIVVYNQFRGNYHSFCLLTDPNV